MSSSYIPPDAGSPFSCSILHTPGEQPQHAAKIPSWRVLVSHLHHGAFYLRQQKKSSLLTPTSMRHFDTFSYAPVHMGQHMSFSSPSMVPSRAGTACPRLLQNHVLHQVPSTPHPLLSSTAVLSAYRRVILSCILTSCLAIQAVCMYRVIAAIVSNAATDSRATLGCVIKYVGALASGLIPLKIHHHLAFATLSKHLVICMSCLL